MNTIQHVLTIKRSIKHNISCTFKTHEKFTFNFKFCFKLVTVLSIIGLSM